MGIPSAQKSPLRTGPLHCVGRCTTGGQPSRMTSLKIELDFKVSAFEKESDAYVRDVLIPASVDALNAAAEAGRLAVVEAMPAFIDRPTPFTLNAISVFEAKAVDPYGHEMSTYVHIMPQQARYLEYEILGGTRGPGD